ncbi:Arabinose efflux permease [Minicystis rosea]|nr:Arabinose efflux permease [Minicystis rosea]
MSLPISERRIVFLVGAIQFVNILDFMMVMPLGPDFARSLGIAASHLGYIGGAYTAAAGLAGLVGALFLDRFDRRRALALAMLGLVVGTAAGGFARDLPSLLAARVVAGAFGGPATSLALAIIADVIPAERRGKALGSVMGAFSIASVLGVPAGLELAQHGGWRTPFFAVGALGLVITGLTFALLPPLTIHLEAAKGQPPPRFASLFRPVVLLSWAMTALFMMASFTLVPNLSAYFQYNRAYPRGSLGTLYLVGGSISFVAMRVVGRLVDRYGAFRVSLAGTIWFLGVLYANFVAPVAGVPVMVIFVAFMLSGSLRGVPHNTLTSKVPSPRERARFMSIQSALQHFASALGAFISAHVLRELPGGALEGIPTVATLSMILGATFPPLAWAVEARLARSRPAPITAETASEA